MSMLAEPRRHRKRGGMVVLPRGKPLFEDDERFGTKMLQRMGWSKGKGLGANENGNEEFVRLQYKNDMLGLGFQERDDQWTQHEESFNGLLTSLKCSTDGDDVARKGISDDEGGTVGLGISTEHNKKIPKQKEKFSGESLEEKSKQSRARVHYKKFTKSKDLTQYSEKDLANIFGKKPVEDEKVEVPLSYEIPEQQVAPQILGNNDVEEGNSITKKETRKAETLIISKLSVTDYFKQKKEAMLNEKKEIRRKSNVSEDNEAVLCPEEQDTKSTSKKRRTELETCDNKVAEDSKVVSEEYVEHEISTEILEGDSGYTTKKHKKKLRREEERSDLPKTLIKTEVENQPKKRKNKAKEELLEITQISYDPQETPRLNKKKKPTSEIVKAPILVEENGNKGDSEISNCAENGHKKMKDMMKKKRGIVEHDDIVLKITNENLQANVVEVPTALEENDENRKESKDSIAERTELKTCDNKVSEEAKVVSEEYVEREISTEILEGDSGYTTKKHKKKLRREEERSDSPKTLIKTEVEDQPKKRKNKAKEELLEITQISYDPQETPRLNKKKKPTSEIVKAPILVEENGNKGDSEISNCAENGHKKMKDMMKKKRGIVEHDDIVLKITNENLQANVVEVPTALGENDDNRKESKDSIADVEISAHGEILEGHDVSASETKARLITVGKDILSVDELIARHNSLNVYTISSFSAEKFRNTDLEQFRGSNMAQIVGYSLNEDLKLNIEKTLKDEENINMLWWKALNKYQNAAPKKSFYTYVRQIYKARKEKKKLPRLTVKKWKRKNVFKPI